MPIAGHASLFATTAERDSAAPPSASPDDLTRNPVHCNLFRDIFGNPFRPVVIDPVWLARRDGVIVKIAQRIYDERAFA